MSKYVILSFQSSFSKHNFIALVNCDYNSILNYVESLSFRDEVQLCFYNIEELKKTHFITLPPQDYLIMNNQKSLYDFKEEVEKKLVELGIEEPEKYE